MLISRDDGAAVAYAIWKLQDRGCMFVVHNDPVYEGMINGIQSRTQHQPALPLAARVFSLSPWSQSEILTGSPGSSGPAGR